MCGIDVAPLEAKLNACLAQCETVEHLLKLIRLEQYSDVLLASGEKVMSLEQFVNGLVLEDLEEMGVKKLGHQKKLMFVCKRLKELRTAASSLKLREPIRG